MIFHTGLVRLKVSKATRRKIRRLRLIRHLGGRCAACGCAIPEVLTVHHVLLNGAEHRRLLIREGKDLHDELMTTFDPKAGRFPVELLCLICHALAHGECAT